jgi:hypothetical protein
MNMPDINIIKNLSLKFQKAFDRGEIDKLYKKMYETAENIATKETKAYIVTMRQEYFEKKLGLADSQEKKPHLLLSNIPNFKSSRIQFHLDQMYRLLELYAKSKSIVPQT